MEHQMFDLYFEYRPDAIEITVFFTKCRIFSRSATLLNHYGHNE